MHEVNMPGIDMREVSMQGISQATQESQAAQQLQFELHRQALDQPDQGSQAERKRLEAVVETLAAPRSGGDSLAELAHDARNMVTALGLYCDLLEEPGVLATQFAHYGSELRLVAAASRRLVEKLVLLDVRGDGVYGDAVFGNALHGDALRVDALRGAASRAGQTSVKTAAPDGSDTRNGIRTGPAAGTAAFVHSTRRWDLMPPELISNLARELIASRNLLSALAGPSIALTVDVEGGALPVRLNSEDLTRMMVNLVKNAAEAMPSGGEVRIGLRKRTDETVGTAGDGQVLSLTLEDNGPGIPRKTLEHIFEAGFTTHAAGPDAGAQPGGGWPSAHRGLGLSITRSIVEAAGGHIYATNREGPGTPGRGARFEIVLPVRRP